jgi:RNA polymerase sigma-70 factor (ECF subfamily)
MASRQILSTNFSTASVYLSQDLDDAALVDRCRTGDTAAFGILAERHRRVLLSVAYRLLGDREDARDATQSAFVKVFEHLDGYDPSHRFFSWVYAILRNECLNVRRSRRAASPVQDGPAKQVSPLDAAEAAERHQHVQAALLVLPLEQREVIVLRHFAGLRYDEIARAVGVPAKTVKSRLYAGRQRLGELLLGWDAR